MRAKETPRLTVKICGVRDAASARAAAEAGADAVGFVFAPSPRRVAPAEARRIAGDLHGEVERVAVFRLAGPDEIARALDEFPADRIQVEATPALLRAPFADRLLPVVHDDGTLEAQLAVLAPDRPVLLEAAGHGGRGRRPDWTRAAGLAARRPLLLAGGLDPDNLGAALRLVRPAGVDVSSGVEDAPGIKSAGRIAAFVAAARDFNPEDA
ncbi:MAG: phosphoribosylanthranilate isomerase [Gemmatimonadales bacterium]|jgi:phosphoribosylanthranilate isomerase